MQVFCPDNGAYNVCAVIVELFFQKIELRSIAMGKLDGPFLQTIEREKWLSWEGKKGNAISTKNIHCSALKLMLQKHPVEK